jgi:hypothetical protein
MNIPLFNKLHAEGFLSELSLEKIKTHRQLFSLHWELRIILYLGITLLTGGLGILMYKNIDSIGHQFVLMFIGLVSAGSFFYCVKNKLPFSTGQVKAPNPFFDYVLLLACLTLLIFIGYFQYQYNIFGNRYGLATCIPMVILFVSAYYFDHLGILSLGITNLAAWLGITITPLEILKANGFHSPGIILTGVLMGIFLLVTGLATKKRNIKAHFEFTYQNFGMHILFICLLAAMFNFYTYPLWFLFLLVATWYFYTKAMKERSFYTLLVSTLYAYVGISYVIIRLLAAMPMAGLGPLYLGLMYFIGSAIGLILFLIKSNKKLKGT